MTNNDKKELARFEVIFFEGGDADANFQVTQDVSPTVENVKKLVFAKIVSRLMVDLLQGEGMPEVYAAVQQVGGLHPDDGDEDSPLD